VIGTWILAGALICTALAQLTYKMYFVRGRHLGRMMGALTLFGLAQIGFFAALTQLEIGVVYMSMGTVQLMVLGLSRYVLRENVGWNHMIAVLMIAGGLIFYAA
jgi:drug/metabolite transporter (DMT)-like permease